MVDGSASRTLKDSNLTCVAEFFLSGRILGTLSLLHPVSPSWRTTSRRAFALTCLRGLLSAVSEGHHKKIPFTEHLCPCCSDQVETIEHVLLHYWNIHATLIPPLLNQFPGHMYQQYIYLLLYNINPIITSTVAKFFMEPISSQKLTLKECRSIPLEYQWCSRFKHGLVCHMY